MGVGWGWGGGGGGVGGWVGGGGGGGGGGVGGGGGSAIHFAGTGRNSRTLWPRGMAAAQFIHQQLRREMLVSDRLNRMLGELGQGQTAAARW